MKTSVTLVGVSFALFASASHANTRDFSGAPPGSHGATLTAAVYAAPPKPVARRPADARRTETSTRPNSNALPLHAANDDADYAGTSDGVLSAGAPGAIRSEDGLEAGDNGKLAGNGGWMERAALRIGQIWTEGDIDLYLTGYAWHNRSTYTRKEVRGFNETSYGGGIGRSIYDEDGDWHALYVMGFKDSFRHFQPMAGYGFQKIARPAPDVRLGYGFTTFMTSRRDMFGGVPFPGVLPLVSAGYGKGTLFATYIPGKHGAGNVAFMFGKWQF